MKQLVILSGKGGTGKTTVAAALAHLASQELLIVLADADVDAANLELVLDPTKREKHDFTGGKLAMVDPVALDTGAELVLVDGPPGIGCPVISASAGADLALHVAEPTISGAHDLECIMGTTDHFGVPSLVAVNKADLNPARSDEIAAFCAERGVELVGRIPYDAVVTEAMVHGRPVTDYTDGSVTEALKEMWIRIRERLFLDGKGSAVGAQR